MKTNYTMTNKIIFYALLFYSDDENGKLLH